MTKRLPSMMLLAFMFCNTAMAAGLDKANTVLENISTALFGIGVVTITIAFMWCGYKVAFQGNTLREVAPVFIGAVIVGSASALASYILN